MAQRLAGRFEARPMKAMNLSPLIGVLLAVFTVVAATSVGLDKAMNLDFQVCGLAPPGMHAPRVIQISVQRDGQAYVGDQRADSLGGALSLAIHEARAHGLETVSLRADADVRYEAVALVARGVSDAGLDINFINEEIH
jgi:biopolymer transport protein ExbD